MASLSAPPPVTVSAPGKILLAGGYLVLEAPNVGLVVAADKRFYTTIRGTNDGEAVGKWSTIRVKSPQFQSLWVYRMKFDNDELDLKPSQVNKSVNPFVEKTLRVTLAYLYQSRPELSLPTTLDICIYADNDFYSILSHLKDRKWDVTMENIHKLPKYLPANPSQKTGLGSSAALTTSLVGALVLFSDRQEGTVDQTVHNLAQICHCVAQGKIGSGFDVSAAMHSSHVYQRFPKEPLQPLLDALTATEKDTVVSKETALLLQSVVSSNLGSVVQPISIPNCGLQVMMADVSGGSESPSMARKVLAYKNQESDVQWNELKEVNRSIIKLFETLDAERAAASPTATKQAPKNTPAQVSSNPTLLELRRAFRKARHLLKQMGEGAKVPIEPDEQTKLADATMELPGVVAALVPGAGGYDALVCLYIPEEGVRERVANLWTNWKAFNVCPLAVQSAEYGQGLRVEPEGHEFK